MSAWQKYGWILRWLGTFAGIAYVVSLIDFDDVKLASARIGLGALTIATLLVALNVVAGALRWRLLLTAYGAEARPSVLYSLQLYFVSFFYNNFLPGAVAGDVARGVVTRECFGERGATAGLAVILVERALGLFGVFLLLAVGLFAAGDSLDTGSLWMWSVIGIVGSFVLVLALPFTRRLARFMPGPLRRIAERVPELSKASAFAGAAALSVVTQVLVALAGYVLLDAVEPRVDIGGSLLIVPLAAATTFLPITVGGAGAREAVYVTLGASLFAMPRADALAASLALWLAHLLVGVVGRVIEAVDLSGSR